MLPNQAPVVIIGGGITGVSTLYHLAKRGVPAVLLERKRLASGTTWHAAGIVGQLRDSSAQTELAKYTTRLFQDLEIETGQATGYKQNGTLNLALSPVRHEQLLRQHDHAARMGVPSFMLSPDAVADYWPDIHLDDVVSAFHVPSNGQVNPLDVTVALAKGARVMGAAIFENTRVDRLDIRDGKVVAVVTDQGTIATSQVVIAAGMWSHYFAKAHGITVPSYACQHWYIVTEPIANLPSDLPILNISEDRTYWKEDAGKLLIGAFEAEGKNYARDHEIPDSFEFDELPFDVDHVAPELEKMFSRMPALERHGIQTFFNGPESFTPDGRPYLGPAPEVKGVYLATGMNSNGILNSGGVGLTMAEWLIDGRPSRSMQPLASVRAHPFQQNTLYNQDRAAESVGFHYGLHWPGRQVLSARGVRRLPLHGPLCAVGAVMAERIGWEVPQYFDPQGQCDGTGWPEQPSIGWQQWSPLVREECAAIQNAAGLFDQSMYAKLLVQGPDACRALNWVCGAQIDIAIGTSVYTHFLNVNGGIEADITVIRQGAEQFLLITGHPSQMRDQQFLRDHADPAWRFEVFDATSAYSLLTIHGPMARAILQTLSNDDLSANALPFGAARVCDLGYARPWVIRRSFMGEVGFELLVSAEFTAHLYDEILKVGAPLGLRHVGVFAINACRLEKGFRHFGHDMGDEDTPYEVGLGFAVSMKKGAFLARDALAEQREHFGTATAYRTVGITLAEATAENGPYLIHNEPIWRDGVLVGYATSGGWGWRVNKMIGLASLHHAAGVTDDWLAGRFTAQIAGEHHPITVQLTPFYDPTGQIMRH